MVQGTFGEARPGQEFGEPIPRPGNIGEAVGSAFVRQPDSHESIFVCSVGAPSADIATERTDAEWPGGIVALSQKQPTLVALAVIEVTRSVQ